MLQQYDYATVGRVFEMKPNEVTASFGGLLCRLQGDRATLSQFEMDQRLFFLPKIVAA